MSDQKISMPEKPVRPTSLKLSIIVVAYDMAREIPRTLQSLTPTYQNDVTETDYEVLVIDNGSPVPLEGEMVASFGRNFRYHYLEDAPPSPMSAINSAVDMTTGDIVCIMIDGARVVTPGIIKYGLLAFELYDDPTVAVLGWHLGPEKQQVSVPKGYNQIIEDDLLRQINWPEDGYRLYDIGSLVGSSAKGWFEPAAESNAIFLKRETFLEMGGYDLAFNKAGGELGNLDFYRRAVERENAPLINLIGEGTFHQVHGGITSNVSKRKSDRLFKAGAARYKKIRGRDYAHPQKEAIYLGHFPKQAIRHLAATVQPPK